MKKIALVLSSLSLAMLVACGGGGSGGGGVKDESNGTSTPVTLSITAAKGLAMVGATVTVTDANGTPSACSGTTDKDGKLSCTLPATFTAPFGIVAQLGADKQYSVVPTDGSNSVNVTPLTTVVVAGLSPTGDPAQFASEVKADRTKASAKAINDQVDQLNTNLRAVIDATVGMGNTLDPMADELEANSGVGHDKLLDAVKVVVTPPNGAVKAKQEISLKNKPDAVITISKDASASKPVPITSVQMAAAKTEADKGSAPLVADLMSRMNACYALAAVDRVGKTDGTGVATDVKAEACKNLFVDNDPTKFKSGGTGVSAKGAFKSLFTNLGDGVVFDQGNLEYVVRNPGAANDGFWIVSYRSTDKATNISYGSFALKSESGVLKQAGNQYDHDASVSSFVQDREFINDSSASYLSTGYNLTVSDKVVGDVSIYKQVTVTSPKGKQLFLKPTLGCSNLGLFNGSKVTCTSFVRLNYGYKDVSKTGDIPALERNILFFVPLETKYSDADLAAIPDQGTWTFKIEFADSTKAAVTQLHRTLSRAPTLGELRKTVFADLTSKAKTDVVSDTKASGAYVFGSGEDADLSFADGADYWTVPDGAIAPTNIKIYGRAPTVNNVLGNPFDDATNVLTSARSTLIKCSRLSVSDTHCSADVAVGKSGFYAAGARATDLQLNANLPGNATRSKHLAFYYPNPSGGTTTGTSAPAAAKTLADFGGTYTITANWQAKDSNGKLADSGTSYGTVQTNANGSVTSCSVGDFIQCNGGLTLNSNKDGVTFTIQARDNGTKSGTLSGTVNSNYVLNGNLNGVNTDGNYTLSGTLTGAKQ